MSSYGCELKHMKLCDKYNKKITQYKEKDLYVLFYKDGCPYSEGACQFLVEEQKNAKGYIIPMEDKEKLFECLKQKMSETGYDSSHRTFPTIFHKGKFIGGFSELKKYVN